MSTYPVLDNRPIDQWKVTELKDELCRRNLSIKGLKDDLVKRLSDALQGETPDGGEQTVGGTPPDDDLKEDVTHNSAGVPLCQAQMEQNIDKSPSEVATQEGNLVVSVTEASKECAVATKDINRETVALSTGVSQETPAAVTNVCGAPDVAATDGSSLSDAIATKGDDLEPVPGDNTTVKGLYSHAVDHSETIAEKALEDGAIKKMTVDDVSFDVASTDVKLDITSAEGKIAVGVSCKILEQEAVPSPLDAIMSHADPLNAEVAATAQEQNSGTLIPEKNFGDNALTYSNDHEDSKCTNGDCNPILSGPKDQVSGVEDSRCRNGDCNRILSRPKDQVFEVSSDLGSQIECASIYHDNMSTNEKNTVKDSLNVDNSDLELESKQNMVKPSSSIPSIDADLQALDDEKKPPKKETSLQETDYITAMNLDEKGDSPNDGSPDKLNLDRSSGDESMKDDVVESKLAELAASSIKSDYLGVKTECTSEHVVEGVTLLDTTAEGSSVHTKAVVAEEKPVTPTKKRKPEGTAQELANNEQIKRQCQRNVDGVKIHEQQASKLSGSDAPKDVFGPALKRSFGRSDSTASGGSPKERLVPPAQGPPTTSLRIDRFVRPFTLKAVQELLGKTGSFCSFWMDDIKTHCYVTYASVEEAVATRNAVYNLQWPKNNGSQLVAQFVDPQEVKLRLESPQPPRPIGPITATTPKAAPFQQYRANLTMPSHDSGTSKGLLPTPRPFTMLPPTSNPGRARENLPPSPPSPEKPESALSLDNLFNKTEAYPRIYYMPVSEEEVAARLAARNKGKKGG